jgi:hypothetical protein
MDRPYYVYAYLRDSDNTPYYVGKGKGRRIFDKHNVSVPKDHSKIVILNEQCTNEEANELEKSYIKLYGRKDLSTGILHNQTDGGDGGDTSQSQGYKKAREQNLFSNKGMTQTAEHIRKRTQSQAGKPRSAEIRAKISATRKERAIPSPNKGKTLSQEHRKKLSLAAKGRPGRKHSEEHKAYMSDLMKGNQNGRQR